MRYVSFYGLNKLYDTTIYHTLFNKLEITLINNKNNIKLKHLSKLLFNAI
jgi:hypothetical protein